MGSLRKEAEVFRRQKEQRHGEALQTAALFLISGIDLNDALKTSGKDRLAVLSRIGRLIERERLKGVRRHWSYDLNRHIALKQAYDRLKQTL